MFVCLFVGMYVCLFVSFHYEKLDPILDKPFLPCTGFVGDINYLVFQETCFQFMPVMSPLIVMMYFLMPHTVHSQVLKKIQTLLF